MLPASSHVALAPRLWKAGPSTVIARTPRAPATRVATATTCSIDGAARPLSVAVSGSAPRSIDTVARLSASSRVHQRQQRVAGLGVVGARVEDHRRQVQVHTREQLLEPSAATPDSPTRISSALTPSVSAASTAALASPVARRLAGERLGDLPAGR